MQALVPFSFRRTCVNTSCTFSGANPHKENFEPLFFRDDEEQREDEDDEGYIPGTSPLNMATNDEVL